MNYSDKLKDPRWQKKRLLIMQRDEWQCVECHDKATTLNVHHLEYHRGCEPWEYEDSNLVTLCRTCHEREHEPTIFNIYLAGKIGPTDWRHSIVKGLRGGEPPCLKGSIFDKHHYVGPFFVSCDHSCGHSRDNSEGEVGHGRSANGCTTSGSETVKTGRSAAFRDCVQGIKSCDFFFAWVEDLTCFGTLVEIGMAHSLKKRIYIGCPSVFPDDLWFSTLTSCGFVMENSESAESALKESIAHAKTFLTILANA